MKLTNKIWNVREKYNYKTVKEILKLKEAKNKDKIFCLFICCIYYPLKILVLFLFFISYPFYKLNNWCRWELDLYD